MRQRTAIEEQDLGRAGDGELRTIPLREQAARLHGKRHMPLSAKAFVPEIRGRPEGGGGIPAHRTEIHGEIGAFIFEQQRLVARRCPAVRNDRQGLDLDFDQTQRIFGNAGGSREYDSQRLADIAHLRFRNHGLGGGLHFRQGLEPHGYARNAVARRGGADVLRREHGMHARKLAGFFNIDGADAAMCHRTAQDRRMQRICAGDIINVLPAPAHKAQVLQALERGCQ